MSDIIPGEARPGAGVNCGRPAHYFDAPETLCLLPNHIMGVHCVPKLSFTVFTIPFFLHHLSKFVPALFLAPYPPRPGRHMDLIKWVMHLAAGLFVALRLEKLARFAGIRGGVCIKEYFLLQLHSEDYEREVHSHLG